MKRLRVDRRVGLLLGGVLLASFVALGSSVGLPAADPELAAEDVELSDQERHGMEVFRSQGCWYCHTQSLRESAVDAAYGQRVTPADIAGLSPAMLGHERIGPDLTERNPRFADAEGLAAYLRDPGREGARTAMPSYAYLGERDLEALAAYLLTLR